MNQYVQLLLSNGQVVTTTLANLQSMGASPQLTAQLSSPLATQLATQLAPNVTTAASPQHYSANQYQTAGNVFVGTVGAQLAMPLQSQTQLVTNNAGQVFAITPQNISIAPQSIAIAPQNIAITPQYIDIGPQYIDVTQQYLSQTQPTIIGQNGQTGAQYIQVGVPAVTQTAMMANTRVNVLQQQQQLEAEEHTKLLLQQQQQYQQQLQPKQQVWTGVQSMPTVVANSRQTVVVSTNASSDANVKTLSQVKSVESTQASQTTQITAANSHSNLNSPNAQTMVSSTTSKTHSNASQENSSQQTQYSEVKDRISVQSQTSSPSSSNSTMEAESTTHCSLPNKDTISNTDANIVDGINLEEIKEFAKAFKIRRLSLGLTQTQVGQALNANEGPSYSQSAICRFEKLDITPKSAQKIKPVLENWMIEAEERYKNGNQTLTEFIGSESNKKRKRRTSFTPSALEILNIFFEKNTHPSGSEMTELAEQLNYDREVVRVWFCNKRQALRNTIKKIEPNQQIS